MFTINILAILVAAAAAFIIGFLFHGPLFGKIWMRLANVTPTGKETFAGMKGQMFANYVANVVLAFVLSGAMWLVFASPLMGAISWYRGAVLGAWMWLFVAAASSVEMIWMGRSKKLWLFDTVSLLTEVAVMGAILAAWQ